MLITSVRPGTVSPPAGSKPGSKTAAARLPAAAGVVAGDEDWSLWLPLTYGTSSAVLAPRGRRARAAAAAAATAGGMSWGRRPSSAAVGPPLRRASLTQPPGIVPHRGVRRAHCSKQDPTSPQRSEAATTAAAEAALLGGGFTALLRKAPPLPPHDSPLVGESAAEIARLRTEVYTLQKQQEAARMASARRRSSAAISPIASARRRSSAAISPIASARRRSSAAIAAGEGRRISVVSEGGHVVTASEGQKVLTSVLRDSIEVGSGPTSPVRAA